MLDTTYKRIGLFVNFLKYCSSPPIFVGYCVVLLTEF